MEILEFDDYKVKFRSQKNAEQFKEIFYSILALIRLKENRQPWHSAHVEEGCKGHIVYQYNDINNKPSLNFIINLNTNFTLRCISIHNHKTHNSKQYKVSQCKELYKDFNKLMGQ